MYQVSFSFLVLNNGDEKMISEPTKGIKIYVPTGANVKLNNIKLPEGWNDFTLQSGEITLQTFNIQAIDTAGQSVLLVVKK